uniref:F-box domain-containing protein n=1 Tax=Panagrolaimus sp. PS1159 TaxID=55785 RepID=A0AC35FJ84_9BILA
MFIISINPFRRLTEKRRQNSTNFESSSTFGISKVKQPKFDPDFSVDGFLSRLQTFQTTISEISTIKDKPILPPKPSTLKTSKNNIPSTTCFIEILKYLPAKELLNLRLVSKEFNQIIQNHSLEFNSVFVENVQLSETSNSHFIRCGTNRNLLKLPLEQIDRPLRHLKTNILDLNGILISQKVLRYLLRSFKYHILIINFNECRFEISANKLARLMNPWKPTSMKFSNSKNVETTKKFPKCFNWFFGEISDSEEIVISILNRFSKFILTQKFENSRLEISFQIDSDFPILKFCVEFEKIEELKNVEEDLSDIEWDDSMDSDAFILSTENINVL